MLHLGTSLSLTQDRYGDSPLSSPLLTLRVPSSFSIFFLRLLGKNWNLVKKVLKVACDVDVGSQGHQRDVSPVLSAHLVFDLR